MSRVTTLSTPLSSAPPRLAADPWRALSVIGALPPLLAAMALPWLEFAHGAVQFGSWQVALIAAGLAFVPTCITLCWCGVGWWAAARELPVRQKIAFAAVMLGTIALMCGHWFAWRLPGQVQAFEYRDAVRLVLWTVAILLLADAVRWRQFGALSRPRSARWVAVLAVAVTVVSAAVALVILDGMPHVIDGATYLLQARMLWSGHLSMPAPLHVDLFYDELVFRVTDGRYYSQYPPLWPLVLGLFDAVGVAWLANAVLCGIVVALTFAVAREYLTRRTAMTAALLTACCPWLWLNGATFLSHVLSTVWLLAFAWCFARTLRTQSRLAAIGAGLALGFGLLTRPQDVAFFAMPCVGLCGWLVCRDAQRWLTRLPLIALTALPALAAYLWVNSRLTGEAGRSPYGDGFFSELAMRFILHPGNYLLWLQENLATISGQWGGGAFPFAAIVLVALAFGWRRVRRLRWLLVCMMSFVVCYGFIRFGGRSWVGPRWYVPLIPLLAMVAACGLDVLRAGLRHAQTRQLSARTASLWATAATVVLLIALPLQLLELRQRPPHGIDGRVAAAASQQQLHNAVVALPVSGVYADTLQPNFKRGIAGMWTMQMPFERSDVIYVTQVEGWAAKCRDAWPGRTLYRISEVRDDFQLLPVDEVTQP